MPSHHKGHGPGRVPAGNVTTDPAPPQAAENAPAATTTDAQASAAAAPQAPPRQQQAPQRREGLNITDLKDMSIQKLTQIAKDLTVARRDRHAQAGADLSDPEGADRAERLHLLGRRARSAARRLRLPARARLQLPAGPRRHLRLAVADPQVRSADRRHGVGPDPAAEGRRALLRADQGRGGQLRGARAGARQAVLREPHAALSAGAADARDAPESLSAPRHGSDDADRQGPARPHRRAAAHRQDDAAAEHRAVGRRRTTPRCT